MSRESAMAAILPGLLIPRKAGRQVKATTWYVRSPSLDHVPRGPDLDTPLYVCDLIRTSATGADRPRSVTSNDLFTSNDVTTGAFPRSSRVIPSGAGLRSSQRMCSSGKRARREGAKEKERRKKETKARWWRKVSHSGSVPENHVGIGFVSESAMLD